MLKRFGFVGMLLAALAVAPLTISAQDWNHNRYNNAQQNERNRQTVQDRNQGRFGSEYASRDRQDQFRYAQSNDRDDRGREMRGRNNYERVRSYGGDREWNR